MKRVLIVTDMDGVLVQGNVLNQKLSRLLSNLSPSIALWTVATGRSAYWAKHGLGQLTPTADMLIADDGAAILNLEGKIISHQALSDRQVEAIVSICQEHQDMVCLSTSVVAGGRHTLLLGPNYNREDLRTWFGEDVQAEQVFACTKKFLRWSRQELILKIRIYTRTRGWSFKGITNLGLQCYTLGDGFSFCGYQFSKAGITKGRAVQRLQYRLGFNRKRTIVLGDGGNDVSMFEKGVAKRRIAVGGRCQALSDIATHHAGNMSEVAGILAKVVKYAIL